MEQNKEIGKFFKEKLNGLERSPSGFQWNAVEQALDKKRNKKRIVWTCGTVLCTAIIIGLAGQFYSKSSNGSQLLVRKNQSEGYFIIDANNKTAADVNAIKETGERKLQNSNDSNDSNDSNKQQKSKPNEAFISNNLSDSIKSKTTENVKGSYKKSIKLIKSTQEYDVYEVTKKYEYVVKKKTSEVANTKSTNPQTEKPNDLSSVVNTPITNHTNKNSRQSKKDQTNKITSPSFSGTKQSSVNKSKSPSKIGGKQIKQPTGNMSNFKAREKLEKIRSSSKSKRTIKPNAQANGNVLLSNLTKNKLGKQKTNLKKQDRNLLKAKIVRKLDRNTATKSTVATDFSVSSKSNQKESSNSEVSHANNNSKNDSIKKINLQKLKAKKIETEKSKNHAPIEVKDTVATEPEETEKEIYVTPFVGLNNYNVFIGNNLSPVYNSNAKTSGIATTYGAFVRVMFNEKIGLRVGFAISNLENTIAIDKTSQPILDYSRITLSRFSADTTLKNIFANDNEIFLTQKLRFFEIPLELYYVWKNDNFGLATNMGMSLLIESSNALTLKSNSVSEFELGTLRSTSTNMNATTNLGVYFTYKITDRLNIEFSPQFKYQLFGIEQAEGLKPIIFTLQTGFSYHLY